MKFGNHCGGYVFSIDLLLGVDKFLLIVKSIIIGDIFLIKNKVVIFRIKFKTGILNP